MIQINKINYVLKIYLKYIYYIKNKINYGNNYLQNNFLDDFKLIKIKNMIKIQYKK